MAQATKCEKGLMLQPAELRAISPEGYMYEFSGVQSLLWDCVPERRAMPVDPAAREKVEELVSGLR